MTPLDPTKKQAVKYAVDLWQRDEQIRQASARPLPRIQPVHEPREESVAIVGYGPSLAETWPKVRDYRAIISCSGSHRFLIERDIVPTWHVEVDPRPHKVALIGAPHPAVEYLIASTCHPAVFDHLKDARVTLWHVFDNQEEGLRILPPGEWAITGGCDVGLRALTLAAFLGFRDLHVFGLDGCVPDPEAARHAGPHPNGRQPYQPCDYEGVRYWTTAGMLEAARHVIHELDQMPAVRATFYGEGLVQAMARHHQPAEAAPSSLANVVGFVKPTLISAVYRTLNVEMHRTHPRYGAGGERHAAFVLELLKKVDGLRSVLDYGCGKGLLGRALAQHNVPIWEYDPAMPGKDEPPRPADLVVCTDVLEHIEPEHLPAVLDDLARCVRRIGYFTIHTGPAQKTLPDGRNTHLIQRDREWWRRMLASRFTVGKIMSAGVELRIMVGPKVRAKGRA